MKLKTYKNLQSKQNQLIAFKVNKTNNSKMTYFLFLPDRYCHVKT